jgi:hypothetical protein
MERIGSKAIEQMMLEGNPAKTMRIVREAIFS